MGQWAARQRRGSSGFNPVRGATVILADFRGPLVDTFGVDSVHPWAVWSFVPSVSGLVSDSAVTAAATSVGAWDAQLVLYADSAGSPGALLASGALVPSASLPTIGSLFSMPGPMYPVVSGTTYWFGLHVTASVVGQGLHPQYGLPTASNIYRSTNGTVWTLGIPSVAVLSVIYGIA